MTSPPPTILGGSIRSTVVSVVVVVVSVSVSVLVLVSGVVEEEGLFISSSPGWSRSRRRHFTSDSIILLATKILLRYDYYYLSSYLKLKNICQFKF